MNSKACESLFPSSQPRLRPVAIGSPGVVHETADGCLYLRPVEALAPLPARLLDRLEHWARLTPEQILVARRGDDGEWQRLSYAQMLESARTIGQHLLEYGLSAERPLLVLSGNALDHLKLALACLYVGIPYCPVSPAYSTLSQDLAKLRHIVERLQPGLVFAADGATYARAIEGTIPADVPLLFSEGVLPGRPCRAFAELERPVDTAGAEAAFARVGPESIAKFLFTSGSTKLPKAVPTTQRMLCANQQMLLQTFPVFAEEPPVLVDWLPWNHTFGGSHNVGIALYNGGTLYIDDGKPTPQGFAETLRNLREISPTAYLTVPKGWEELVGALETDDELRERFFARMRLFFFAAAGLSHSVRERLDRVAEAHCGERIRTVAGLGMTETAPSCTFSTGAVDLPGYVGVPAPGCEVKLAPVGDKLEARFRGPHVMAGYWREPELSAEAFDEEGYYRSGDALRLVDPERPELGLLFDGRIAEDFKLSSGVFVSVGPLRARVILAGAPYIQDVVVTGPNRPELALLIFPRLPECRALAGLPESAPVAEVLASPALRTWLRELLDELNRGATGNASRLAWACLLAEPPCIDRGEVTDKGSINQRAVLQHRAALIDALYAGEDAGRVLPGAGA
ncbi:feruloyl-CoA synthase [Azotobacter vinelandii CA]|uniref:Feruoyl-CoA synthetase n=2 Tax=Azotobacter vinelandii TaxID=354 RepID=C1DQW8_AZOVD|nr:feruloyl-CoA synthase [Azotobacter vinelandii]ACO77641.1 feruoyl-CoA synthetase [Azotobacter vinelandii DJ]AGK12559.1 feruloyl-CoA synthase [Azotobacter vinelandii CA]AGK17853.1 feruloyl-CoA synthase [Azotobacter vinelandii CA6]SFY29012.1 trans-feruloyl-CoA synthase [Azotobacter vinelandii]GLK61707.1 feruloyl-CoA synthase [Azotobacter vinelandii]